jgi:hypothetical protein
MKASRMTMQQGQRTGDGAMGSFRAIAGVLWDDKPRFLRASGVFEGNWWVRMGSFCAGYSRFDPNAKAL